MKLSVSLLATLALPFVPGCFVGICESWAIYNVNGRILDSANGEPIVGAQVALAAYREGVVLSYHDATFHGEEVDETGRFESYYTADADGGPCGGLWPDPPAAKLGAPPDEIVVYVRTDTRVGIASIKLRPEQVQIVDDWEGTIELGDFMVTLAQSSGPS